MKLGEGGRRLCRLGGHLVCVAWAGQEQAVGGSSWGAGTGMARARGRRQVTLGQAQAREGRDGSVRANGSGAGTRRASGG